MRFAILVLTSFLAAFSTLDAMADERPNFIVIIGDDISWNDIGAYGHPHVQTPNVDRMAQEGLRFDYAFLTCSSCSPSRCSIMTGRYPHNTGAAELHQPLPKNQVVFAGLLKEAGYYTAAAGKWHLGPHARANFDTIVGGSPSGCENWVQVLEERPRDQPFFLWFAAFDAHRPYERNIIDRPHTPEEAVIPPYFPDAPEVRDDLNLYYDEIARLDQYTGKVLAELKRQGVDDNTMVIYMADNGRPFPRDKTTILDSGVRTPFVVRWPSGIKPGGVTSSLVSAIDIAPTILELAGLEIGETFQGKSFAPILADPKQTTREYVFAEHNWHDYQAHERGVRNHQWLYVENAFPELTASPPADAVRSPTYRVMQQLESEGKLTAAQRHPFIAPRPAVELYDVKADPFQLENLAGQPEYREAEAQMKATLQAWREETDDQIPKNPTPDRFHRQTGEPLKTGE